MFTSGPDESIGGTPPFNVAFIEGTVGWRRQIEGHTPVPNWPTFAMFAARYLNDGRPVVTPGQKFVLGEGSGALVGTVDASDADAGDALGNWQVKGGDGAGLFTLAADTGEITIKQPLKIDFLRRLPYTLTVIVGDGKLPSNDEQVTIQIPDQVNMCHNGHRHRTITVPRLLVPLHLLLGDAIGSCGH